MTRKYRHNPMQSAFPEIREWLVADLAALPFGEPTWAPGPSPPTVRPHFAGCEPEPRGYARDPARFGAVPPPDEAVAVVRGALADAFDRAFSGDDPQNPDAPPGPLGCALWQGKTFAPRTRTFVEELFECAAENDRAGFVKALRGWGMEVFQQCALALFPELYADDPLAVGIFPDGGAERVGPKRVEAVAELIRAEGGGRGRAKPKDLLRDVTGRAV